MTRKITDAVARIKLGLQDKLLLGNLDAQRDWGYRRRYVEAMWLMLQQDAAGRLRHRHRANALGARICRPRLRRAGLDWQKHVEIDPRYLARPKSTCSWGMRKAERRLGWKSRTDFAKLVELMVAADLRILDATRRLHAA